MINRRSFVGKLLLSTAACILPTIGNSVLDSHNKKVIENLLQFRDELNAIPHKYKFEMCDIKNYCKYLSDECKHDYDIAIEIIPSDRFNTIWGQGFSEVCTFNVKDIKTAKKYIVDKNKIYNKTNNGMVEIT